MTLSAAACSIVPLGACANYEENSQFFIFVEMNQQSVIIPRMNYIDGEVVLLALIMFCARYAMGWRREWTKFVFAEFLLMRISFVRTEGQTDRQI